MLCPGLAASANAGVEFETKNKATSADVRIERNRITTLLHQVDETVGQLAQGSNLNLCSFEREKRFTVLSQQPAERDNQAVVGQLPSPQNPSTQELNSHNEF
ncbi:hypothetical protein FGO68_gene12511 [Halteria grandinella]|uniref:Uncharacterized protein n=1 Tax=Halteria grandinella TaxID=5974 RepID=A0A8J8N8T4_HALGN|nr:hypothetical protein FGO68_gene12511 [Halteria grandinella]